MTVFVVLKSLKNDPMEIDSIWSTHEQAQARIGLFDDDDYYSGHGNFQILEMRVDEVNHD